MDLNQWYEKGMNPNVYIDAMEKNKAGLLHIYDNFTPPESDGDLFQKINQKNLRIIAITEDWCGDAMLNIPILLRFTDHSNTPVRMLLRDENLELMDQYLTNGRARSIPIFIFINKTGKEVARWGPRAKTVQQFIDESSQELPPKTASDYEEKAKEMRLFMNKAFRSNREIWEEVYTSIKETAAEI